mgnify:CR=1 FL=1
MFSSIILSLAMNVAPVATTDIVQLDIQEIGTRRKQIRISDDFEIQEAGTRRKQIRI